MNETDLIYLVDDDQSVREALSSLIRSVGLRVQTYASADAFLADRHAHTQGPACLVLDVRMPGMGGLELQRALKAAECPMPIIFITGHGDIPMTVRAMKDGAMEFLPKPFGEQDLLDAIRAALERSRAERRAFSANAELRMRFASLSAREREVLALVLKGLRNKQAADQLGISEVTVKVHRHHAMEKMQAASVPNLLSMLRRIRADRELGLDEAEPPPAAS